MMRVFISGPYTLGDVAINVSKAMNIANDLINLGYAPFCPHLTHFLHINKPQKYEKWLELDIKFLEVCDVVLRIPGKSNGADLEVEYANKIGLPVFYSIDELLKFFKEKG